MFRIAENALGPEVAKLLEYFLGCPLLARELPKFGGSPFCLAYSLVDFPLRARLKFDQSE